MMASTVLSLAADYGVPILFLVTFLSCLALPVPSSLLMLACGGFAAMGDLSLSAAIIAAFSGAVLGDNTGYWMARTLSKRMKHWLLATPRRATLHDKAVASMDRRGGIAVFLSTWLVAPLGPYVNYISGLTRFSWPRFAFWGAAGEAVWVGLYIGLGFLFANQITEIAALAANLSGFIAALVLAVGLGMWLMHAARNRHPKTAGNSADAPHI